jgi:protein-tyrosine phosphatase
MVDLHCHILPGLDDGAQSMNDAVDLARAAQAAGIDTVVATPHVRDDYPFPLSLIPERVAQVQSALSEAGVAVKVLPGAEVSLSKLPDLDDETLSELCLGASRYLLVESPYTRAPALLETALFNLQLRGFRPMLAHPERSGSFITDPARLEQLAERGVLSSVTAMSVAGAFGTTVRDFAARLFASGVVHNIASDSHDAMRRAPGFDAALEQLAPRLEGGAPAARWFTEDVPRAIVGGREIPGVPPTLTSKASGWRRLKERVGLA